MTGKKRGRKSESNGGKLPLVVLIFAITFFAFVYLANIEPRLQGDGCGPKCEYVSRPWNPGQLIPINYLAHHHAADVFHGDYFPDTRQIVNVLVTGSGKWSEIFDNPPSGNDVILIPEGVTVTYDVVSDTSFRALVLDGKIIFDPDKDTRLTLETIQLYETGNFEMLLNDDTKAEVVFDGEVNTVEDPGQFNLGLITFGGTVNIRGKKVRMPFTKLEPVFAGESSFTLTEDPLDWKVGDLVNVADTGRGRDLNYKYFDNDDAGSQNEQFAISSINGREIGIDGIFQYDHDGYVAHLTRTASFRSKIDGATESEASLFVDRAHMLISGHAFVDIRYAEFVDMGRTRAKETVNSAQYIGPDSNGNVEVTRVGNNQIARYANHMHHVHEPSTQIGNSVYGLANHFLGSPKFAYVCHSSYCIQRDLVAIGAAGTAYFYEDGPEFGSVDHTYSSGTGYRSPPLCSGDEGRLSVPDLGHCGFGYWMRGPLMKMRDNVATGQYQAEGFLFFNHGLVNPNRFTIVPNIPGMPQELIGEPVGRVAESINDYGTFERNIFDGLAGQAMFGTKYNFGTNIYRDLVGRLIGTQGSGYKLTHSATQYLINPQFTSIDGGSTEIIAETNGPSNRFFLVNGDFSGFGSQGSVSNGVQFLNSEPPGLPGSVSAEPTIFITTPTSGSVVTSENIVVEYEVNGEIDGVDHVAIYLDSGEEVVSNSLPTGTYTFENVLDGEHVVSVALHGPSHELISQVLGQDFSIVQVASSTICGNGVQEVGEGCDEGEANSPTGSCNTNCQATYCGDNVIQQPNADLEQEECESGESRSCVSLEGISGVQFCNNVCSFDSCIVESTGVCGNDVQEIGEECDGSDIGLCSSGSCQSTCTCEIPPESTIQIISPKNDEVIISDGGIGSVTVVFNVAQWDVLGKGENHVQFSVSDGSGYDGDDVFNFYNGADSLVEFNSEQGPTNLATWIGPNTLRFTNVPIGEHTLTARLVSSDGSIPQNNGATTSITFSVDRRPVTNNLETEVWKNSVSENEQDLLDKGSISVSLGEREKVDLNVLGSDVYIGVRNVFGATSALVEISTDPITLITIENGESRVIDIDGDGVPDIRVSVNGFDSSGNAILDVSPVSSLERPLDSSSRAIIVWIIVVALIVIAVGIVIYFMFYRRKRIESIARDGAFNRI